MASFFKYCIEQYGKPIPCLTCNFSGIYLSIFTLKLQLVTLNLFTNTTLETYQTSTCHLNSWNWVIFKRSLIRGLALPSSATTLETPRTTTFQETFDTVAKRTPILLWSWIPPQVKKLTLLICFILFCLLAPVLYLT